MASPVSNLSGLARSAIYIQQHDLVSRGIIDALGTSVPVIGLARTPLERREKILDRIVVIGSLFLLAPAHAWVLMHAFAKHYKLPVKLMRFSYNDVLSAGTLKKALNKLSQTDLKKLGNLTTSKNIEALRQRIVKAKTNMFVPDLMLECFLLGGVGWITNLCSRYLTGRNRFTGELNETSKENLEALYQKEKKYQDTERYRMIATLCVSTGVPIILGTLLHKAVMPKIPKTAFAKWFRPKAKMFDYVDGCWMSLTSLWTVCLVQLSGHLLSARNKRELRENFIREMMINYVCMNFMSLCMGVMKPLIYKPAKLPMKSNIVEMLQKLPATRRPKAALIGAATYFTALGLNSAALAGAILFNNYLTHQKVQKDVRKLHSETSASPQQLVYNTAY